MAKEFLGTGWTFPVKTGPGGAIAMSSAEDEIHEAIRIILGTAKGERVMRPDFGCGIHKRVFSVINTSNLGIIETEVKDALIQWEPRIEVLSVVASAREAAVGKLIVEIDYRVRVPSCAGKYWDEKRAKLRRDTAYADLKALVAAVNAVEYSEADLRKDLRGLKAAFSNQV